MSGVSLNCRDEQRREAVRLAPLFGIDHIEVSDNQLTLRISFLGKAPAELRKENVRVEGGVRIQNIKTVSVHIQRQSDPDLDDCMNVTVDQAGDFSTYCLCLVEVDEQGQPIVVDASAIGSRRYKPLTGFDPRYVCVEFSFKAGCPNPLDCQTSSPCPPVQREEPEINYLAKDYSSFRQLILDRLALLLPDWHETHIPDLGVTLVELLAYAGDYLSYYQDAVATEAYLDTARLRISVRRHARLVDYFIHEGCNARAWTCITVSGHVQLMPRDICFLALLQPLPGDNRVLTPADVQKLTPGTYEAFEPFVQDGAQPIQFYLAHNEICFWTWGDRDCCLPRGATSATLIDQWVPSSPPTPAPTPTPVPSPNPTTPQNQVPGNRINADTSTSRERALHLSVGDILIFEEILGPKTGSAPDADPSHRHAVRLTKVQQDVDKLYELPDGQPVANIEWAPEDALPFPLCISSVTQAPDCIYLPKVSVARGNVLLVDHGLTTPEPLDSSPTGTTVATCGCECTPAETTVVPRKFRPGALKRSPLTYRQPLQWTEPASAWLAQDPRMALPQITLTGLPASGDSGPGAPAPDPTAPQWQWQPRRDLLSSGSDDQSFVVEIDNDGDAHLRFGNGELGRAPDPGTTFQARYRAGSGIAGNVGPEAISYIVCDITGSGLAGARNPLSASGGIPCEPMDEVKLFAPFAFQKQLERAMTANDYASIAQQDSKLQRAAADLRWNGSWYEVRLAIDPEGTEAADASLLNEIKHKLHRCRRIGQDLRVEPATYIPLDLELKVCVQPQYLRGHVEAAILDLLSTRILPSGQRGFFHPDNLSFGDGIYESRLVAVIQAVPGVQHVEIVRLERLFLGSNDELKNGVLALGAMEIAQLDNDPVRPENGRLVLDMRGGR
jgi:hypothetical protein